MNPKRSIRRGFTLIELLVSLAVMATLALLSWRGLDGMLRAQSQTEAHAQSVGALQMGLLQWRADLDSLIHPKAAGGSAGGELQALLWHGAALTLTRQDASAPDKALRVVSWKQKDVEGVPYWCRRQSDLLRTRKQWQEAWDEALGSKPSAREDTGTDGQQGTCTPVAPIVAWQVYFYRGDAWSNAASSADAGKVLPDGIRLQLEVPAGHPLAGKLVQDWASPTLSGNKS